MGLPAEHGLGVAEVESPTPSRKTSMVTYKQERNVAGKHTNVREAS